MTNILAHSAFLRQNSPQAGLAFPATSNITHAQIQYFIALAHHLIQATVTEEQMPLYSEKVKALFTFDDTVVASTLERMHFMLALTGANNLEAWRAAAFLGSGAACQVLRDAHTVTLELNAQEIRDLVAAQCNFYIAYAATQPELALSSAPKNLLTTPVFNALSAAPLSSYRTLRAFFDILTSYLPAPVAERVAYRGYFENNAQHEQQVKQSLTTAQCDLIALRHTVFSALLALRHATIQELLKNIFDFRLKITRKNDENALQEFRDQQDIERQKQVMATQDIEEQKSIILTYIPRSRFAIKREETSNYYAELQKYETERSKKGSILLSIYQERLHKACNTQDFKKYLSSVSQRETELRALVTQKSEKKEVRQQELQALEREERDFIVQFAQENPIAQALELVFLVVEQDFTRYSMLHSAYKKIIARLLHEDIQFFLDYEESKVYQGLPAVIAANAPAYLFFLKIAAQVFLLKKNKTGMFATPEILWELKILDQVAIRDFWRTLSDALLDAQGNINNSDIMGFFARETPFFTGAHLERSTAEMAFYRHTAYQDSLKILLNQSTLLALFISVDQDFLLTTRENKKEENIRNRIIKILERHPGECSPLENYFYLALVAMLDKKGMNRLLVEGETNPFYCILRAAGGITLNDFTAGMQQFVNAEKTMMVKSVISQLSNTQETSVTLAEINDANILCAYLQAALTALPQATELDFLIHKYLPDRIADKHRQYSSLHPARNTKNITTDFVVSSRQAMIARLASAQGVANGSLCESIYTSPQVETSSPAAAALSCSPPATPPPPPPPRGSSSRASVSSVVVVQAAQIEGKVPGTPPPPPPPPPLPRYQPLSTPASFFPAASIEASGVLSGAVATTEKVNTVSRKTSATGAGISKESLEKVFRGFMAERRVNVEPESRRSSDSDDSAWLN